MKSEKILIFGVLIFQIVVLAGMLANKLYPIWTGQEVKLAVYPVDPRSMFRGNYTRLKYKMTRVQKSDLGFYNDERPKVGDFVYVVLKEKKGIYVPDKYSMEVPKSGMFIRGRVDFAYSYNGEIWLKFGIESYFTTKRKALAIEKAIRKGWSWGTEDGKEEKIPGVAVLRIASNGKASIVDLKVGDIKTVPVGRL